MKVKATLYLSGYEGEGHADHDEHEQLAQPDVGRDVPVAHGREGHDHEVHRLEHRQGGRVTATLDVLDAAHTGSRVK